MPGGDLSNVIKHLLFVQFFHAWSFLEQVANDWCLCIAHLVRKIQTHQSSLNSHSKFKKKSELSSMSSLKSFFPHVISFTSCVPFSHCYLFQIPILGPVLSLANTSQSWHLTPLKISSAKAWTLNVLIYQSCLSAPQMIPLFSLN